MHPSPHDALLACAADPGADVAEAALWLAADDHPGLEVPPWLERIDELGEELRTRSGHAGLPPLAVPVIASLLRDRVNLHPGSGADPRAHYLHDVLDQGACIPISCSVLWMAVGRRAGIPVEGVGMPGHFLVRVGSVLVDAHGGGVLLSEADALRVASAALGRALESADPAWLRAATVREILARMSRNLRACHAALSAWPLALRAADRCVALLPDHPAERRDRGLLLWRAGQALPALRDLTAYLEAAPDAPDRDGVEAVVARLRAFAN